MSDAVASGDIPAASAAPAPPDDPPGEYRGFQGFRVTPQSGLWVTVAQLYSGVVVRAWMIPPAARIRSMTGWSCSAITSRWATSPCDRVWPASPCFSFAATGRPSSGEMPCPRA